MSNEHFVFIFYKILSEKNKKLNKRYKLYNNDNDNNMQ